MWRMHIKTREEQIVEERFAASVPDLLRVLYLEDRLTQEQVAEKLDVSRSTVIRWMKRHDIDKRQRQKAAAA